MKRVAFLMASILLVVSAIPRRSQALPPPEKDWEIEATAYVWAASLQTEAEARGVESTIDLDFSEIYSDLGWGFMGGVAGRYKRGLLLIDSFGLQVSTPADAGPRTFTREFRNGDVTSITAGRVNVGTRLTLWDIDIKGGFRAFSMPIAKLGGSEPEPEDRRRLDFDLLAGIRIWDVDTKQTVTVQPATLTVNGVARPLPGILPRLDLGNVTLPGALLGGGHTDVENSVTWVDPIVGFRVRGDVTNRWSLFAIGDIGGWSAFGESSDLTWQGMLGSRFDITDHLSVEGGYRALGVNRDTAIKNTILYGPQLGMVIRF